jgi:hypothetical protein
MGKKELTMCTKCVRRHKRLGLPKWFSYGKAKVYAHRLINGEPIPLFCDRRVNAAIEAHVHKIERARSKK